MANLRVEFHLPGITVTADKIDLKMPRRRGKESGPFSIVSRATGLALDTALHHDVGHRVSGYTSHTQRQQLWWLVPAGKRGEVVIKSTDNGLVLDCGRESGDYQPRMNEASGEPWQSWLLESAPDGLGHTIQSAHSRRYMVLADAAEEGRSYPRLTRSKGTFATQWIIAQPVGALT